MDASFFSFRNSRRTRTNRNHQALQKRVLTSESLEDRRLLASDVMITEFMASNSETLRSDGRAYHDWIELHNPTDETVSLEGWYLTDDSNELDKWQIPAVDLEANGYLVVYASRLNLTDPTDDQELHTNFKLASEGDYLALVKPDNSVAQAFSPRYPDQRTDVSFGYLFDENGVQAGDAYYFETPSPGEANGASTIQSIVEPVTIDVPRGYYDEPFDVNLTANTPGATIKYTTDGSWPSADNGETADGPVRITTTTTLRVGAFADNMLASDVNTNTYIFLNDVFQQTGEGLPDEWGYFDDQGPRRPARVSANYAVDPDIVNHEDYKDTLRDDMRSVPTVSLVVDPEDLWPLENGLLSNTELKGDRWERQVSAEWMNVEGETEWATNAGIRIHGGWARRPSQTKKFSFKVIFRGQYGDSNLVHPVFGEDGQQEFQTIIMRGGFNDSWRNTGNSNNTYMQDQWSRKAQRDMGGNTSRDRYVHLYLNGLYWGMYSATERMNAEWASAYMGGDPEEWDVINTGGNVIDGNSRAFTDLMRLASRRDVTYEEMADAVDVDKYIDYMLVNQYVGNWDWPHNNWYASRRRVDGAKWEFHTWDAEAAFQRGLGEDRVHNDRNTEVGPSRVYTAFLRFPEFQELYATKAYEHLFNDGELTPERGMERLREIAAGMDRAIVGESLRWGDGKDDSGRPLTRETWTRRITSLERSYFPRRGDSLIRQLQTVRTPLVAPLYPEIEAPLYNQFGGQVTPDFDITITSDLVGGSVYYTNDGTDPRNDDGTIRDTAIRLTSFDLIDESSPAKVLVPTGNANESNWQSDTFDDASWSDGTAAIGYETGTVDDPLSVPGGFTVTKYDFENRPNSLTDVDGWVANNEGIEGKATFDVPYINFLDGRRGGDFDDDFSFPNELNNYGTQSTGTMKITKPGPYTFIVTSNDAARVSIDGNEIYADEGRHGTESTLFTVDLAVGEHPVEIWHFDRSGTGVLEFGFSEGTKTEFDDSFQLVGNSSHRDFSSLIATDLQDQMLGKSASAYLRIPFNVEDPDNIGSLLLRPRFGDGYAAYLNGTLVASENAPEELSHTSTAASDRFDSAAIAQTLVDLTERKDLLKPGQNTLAIHALNNSADDIDMFFSPDLIMTLAHAPINVDQSTNIQARVFIDGEWSALTNAQFLISDPASSENLRVSEVNYHPSNPTATEIEAGINDADDFEYIELANISDKAVDLSNVRLTQLSARGATEGVAFDFADSDIFELGPGEHVLVVEDLAAFESRYGTDLPVAGQWSGALSNNSETISVMAGDTLVQRFEYDDAWYFMTDGNGATLEVFNPAAKGVGDWGKAETWRASNFGGTPGVAGSIQPGDANGDGIFDSDDLILAFQAAEYEDDIDGNSTFAEGDWNGDGDFTSTDIIVAFVNGNYRGGEVAAPAAVAAARADFNTDSSDTDDDQKRRLRDSLNTDDIHDDIFSRWV